MLINMLLGVYSGLPLALTLGTLQAWMTDEKVDLRVIGLMTLVGLPYTLKFLWAPLFDRVTLPFLGRRRGWLFVIQLVLVGAIFFMSQSAPSLFPGVFAAAAFLVAFFSASQDIVIDAWRREALQDKELGLGSSLYVNGYRIGMLISGAGALFMADHMNWRWVYTGMAAVMATGLLATLVAPEPEVEAPPPRSLKEAVIEPFVDYFERKGAWLILAFILLYKVGDTMASALTTTFYLELGFTKSEVAAVVKGFGFAATLLGGFLGGVWMLRLGIYRALWIFGILQAASTAGFALLAQAGHSVPGLSGVIFFENLTGGMGTSAYVAFMASLTNKRFTATQYALLSSLMGIPRVIVSAPTGYLVHELGWFSFFLVCTVIALPGMLLLRSFKKDLTATELN